MQMNKGVRKAKADRNLWNFSVSLSINMQDTQTHIYIYVYILYIRGPSGKAGKSGQGLAIAPRQFINFQVNCKLMHFVRRLLPEFVCMQIESGLPLPLPLPSPLPIPANR